MKAWISSGMNLNLLDSMQTNAIQCCFILKANIALYLKMMADAVMFGGL